jgi:fatty acid desaturase
MQLRTAFIHWAIALGGLILLLILNAKINLAGIITFVYYIVAGIYLSKAVLKNLIDWHPVNRTIDNESSTKLGFLLLWPIRYLVLFMKLGVTKVL